MHSTVSSRGQTAVPAGVRRHFRLEAHSRLEWIIDGDLITVLPLPANPLKMLRGSLKGRYSANMLLTARARERARERRTG